MDKHDKKLSDVWEISSRLSDIYGITGFMYGCAVNILSSVWKYGEELRVQHNSKYNHNGERGGKSSGFNNFSVIYILYMKFFELMVITFVSM